MGWGSMEEPPKHAACGTHLACTLIPIERILRHDGRANGEDGKARENDKLLRMMRRCAGRDVGGGGSADLVKNLDINSRVDPHGIRGRAHEWGPAANWAVQVAWQT